jgi:HlyD family secretion protein
MRGSIMALALVASVGCQRNGTPDLIQASGQVEATDVRIAAKIPGRLASVSVKEGDRVAAGQEIARVETTDLELSLRQAKADAAQAAAELALRQEGPRREDIAELRAKITGVVAEKEAAERDLGRMQELLDRGSGTTKARDDARTRRDSLDAQLASMRQALGRLESGSRPQEIDSAAARERSLLARAAQIEQQIADASVKSPLAGIVTEKVAEAGEIVTGGAPLAVVTDLADAWLSVYVAETDLGRIRMGQEVEVVTDDGQKRKGRITYVAAKAEFTPRNVQTRDERVRLVYEVKVTVDNADGLFKPGMPATAQMAPQSGGAQ